MENQGDGTSAVVVLAKKIIYGPGPVRIRYEAWKNLGRVQSLVYTTRYVSLMIFQPFLCLYNVLNAVCVLVSSKYTCTAHEKKYVRKGIISAMYTI